MAACAASFLPQSLPAGRQVARGFCTELRRGETGYGVFALRNLSADKGRLVVPWLYVVAFDDEKTKRIITELHRGLAQSYTGEGFGDEQ
jgi:hypothetical protein